MTAPSPDRSRSFPLSSTSCARRRASPADTNGLPDPNVSPWRSCIDAYVCYQSKQTFILEHFSRSTRFVHFGPHLGFQFFHRSKLSVQSKKMAKFGDKELIWWKFINLQDIERFPKIENMSLLWSRQRTITFTKFIWIEMFCMTLFKKWCQKCCKTPVYLQNSVPIQPKTSHSLTTKLTKC